MILTTMEDMMNHMRATSTGRHPDDYAIFPDGTYATLGEVWDGEFDWLSDDYEIVDQLDDARLIELGLMELVAGEPG